MFWEKMARTTLISMKRRPRRAPKTLCFSTAVRFSSIASTARTEVKNSKITTFSDEYNFWIITFPLPQTTAIDLPHRDDSEKVLFYLLCIAGSRVRISMKITKTLKTWSQKTRLGGTKSVVFGKMIYTTLISMERRTRGAPKTWEKWKKLKSDEPYYTCVVGLVSLMDLDPLLIAVLTDA